MEWGSSLERGAGELSLKLTGCSSNSEAAGSVTLTPCSEQISSAALGMLILSYQYERRLENAKTSFISGSVS